MATTPTISGRPTLPNPLDLTNPFAAALQQIDAKFRQTAQYLSQLGVDWDTTLQMYNTWRPPVVGPTPPSVTITPGTNQPPIPPVMPPYNYPTGPMYPQPSSKPTAPPVTMPANSGRAFTPP
jgi:hypothetical protein